MECQHRPSVASDWLPLIHNFLLEVKRQERVTYFCAGNVDTYCKPGGSDELDEAALLNYHMASLQGRSAVRLRLLVG